MHSGTIPYAAYAKHHILKLKSIREGVLEYIRLYCRPSLETARRLLFVRLYVPVSKADGASDKALHRCCTRIFTRISCFRHQPDCRPHLDLSALAMPVDPSIIEAILAMALAAEGKSAPKQQQ